MKRVFLVIREFSYTNDEKNFSKGDWLPEVFTTINNAKAFIEKYTKDGETLKEEKVCGKKKITLLSFKVKIK